MQALRKISIAKVYGEVEKPKNNKPIPIMIVAGTAVGTKTGQSDFGPYTGLKGEFGALNVSTGEEFRANICYLPDPALLPVLVALEKDDVRSVEFSYLISAIKSKTPVGYEYVAEPTTEPKEGDPVGLMLQDASKRAAKMLPAPESKKSA